MRQRTISVLQAFFVVFLWATSWVLVKHGLHDIPPITFAGLRYFLAFICLLVVSFLTSTKQEVRTLSKSEWMRFILLGVLLYAVTQGSTFVALAHLPAVTVNILWSFSSVVIALLGMILLAEQPAFFQWAGMFLAVIGAVIYFYPVEIPRNQSLGFVVAAIGICTNAISSILGRDINRLGKHNPLIVTVISMGAGSIILLAAGITLEETPSLNFRSWAIIIWLALVNTAFAFTLWNHTLRTLTAMESSVINGMMTVWIAIFAVLFLGEQISLKEIAGLFTATIGTIIVQLRSTTLSKQN